MTRALLVSLLLLAVPAVVPGHSTGEDPAPVSGAELSMPQAEGEKILFVRPNELKVANFVVNNTGGLPDKVYLNLSVNFYGKPGAAGKENATRGWWVWLDNYTLELKGQESRKVRVWVRGPESGKERDYTDTTIEARSEGNQSKTSTIKFRTYLIINRGLVLKASLNMQETRLGVAVTYKVTVQNMGDMVEEVLLANRSPPDWKAALDKNKVTVGPKGALNSRIMLNLTVLPPPTAKAGQIGIVTVTGRLAAQQTIKSTIVTHTIVGESMYLVLEAPDNEHWIDPGTGTDYELKVTNYGNMAGTVIIILEIVTGTGDWFATLSANSVGLRGGESKFVTLTVTMPPDARAGERLVVKVKGYNGNRTQEASVDLTTHVNAVHCLKAGSSTPEQATFPGESALYDITVSNCGNAPESVGLVPGITPAGWSLAYYDGVNTSSDPAAPYLAPGENWTFVAAVTPPHTARAGVYGSAVRVGGVVEVPLLTRVEQVHRLELTTGTVRKAARPGTAVHYTLAVRNDGNGNDTVSFKVQGLPKGWAWEFMTVDMEPVSGIVMAAGSSVSLILSVTPPADPHEATYLFGVLGISHAGGLSGRLSLVLDTVLPDLSWSGVEVGPAAVYPAGGINIRATLKNGGRADAEDFFVVLLADGEVAGVERIERLEAGSVTDFTFSWSGKPGHHELLLVVDRRDRVAETRDDNNALLHEVTVKRREVNATPGFDATALLAGLAATLMAIRQRRSLFLL